MAKQTAKKMSQPERPLKERLIDAALILAEQLGWAHVTMSDIAGEAGCSLAELHDVFESKGDIIAAYERGVTRRVLESAASEPGADPRDALFDLLMDRFEILNEQRPALISILAAYRFDPKEYLLALPILGRSMGWMLEAAGLDTAGWRGAARLAGLTAVYLSGVRAWMDDDSVDLAKTMAALDKNLARAQDWAGRFNL